MTKTGKSTKPEPKTAKAEPKAEVVQPLKVEITFPAISDLKQALAFDADGNLIITVQFKARVDQFEIFRLVNLLKQPHGTLFAIIGSPQSAMDFIFDKKRNQIDILKAASKLVAAKTDDKGDILPADQPQELATAPADQASAVAKITAVAFNHIQEEEKPYGVAIDYVADGSGEIHTVTGRGMNPTEAVLAGVKATNALPAGMNEPFEVMAALELLDPSPECYKLIRAIKVGSFDEEPGQGESEQAAKGK